MLRVYLTDHVRLWRIYTLWLQESDGSFYYKMPSLHLLKGNLTHHTSYHPSGQTHFKPDNSEKKIILKKWPNYKDLRVVPIDSFGFNAKDFLRNDPIFNQALVEKIQTPSILFDITKNMEFFQLRIWFGQTKYVENWKGIKDRLIETSNTTLVAAQFHRFGEIAAKLEDKSVLGKFDLSCVVALVYLDTL